MNKILIIVDAQNDFIDGKLGSLSAIQAVPKIIDKINSKFYDAIFITQDYHIPNSAIKTIEEEKVPEHCLFNNYGMELNENIFDALCGCSCGHKIIKKSTFMSTELSKKINDLISAYDLDMKDTIIEICGFCTDICVISNALYLRSMYPHTRIICDSEACAGTTPEMHSKALDIMRSNLINVIY